MIFALERPIKVLNIFTIGTGQFIVFNRCSAETRFFSKLKIQSIILEQQKLIETENNESFLFFTMFAFWLECVISEMFMVSKVI